jgi:predicted enzyme related to lactoylglutathione lyase
MPEWRSGGQSKEIWMSTTTFATTKLIVHDLEKLATFYCEAYGFEQTSRIQADIAGEPIDEIFLGKDGEGGGSLILMKYVERPAPNNGEVALVFTTDDVEALCDGVRAAGGGVYVEPYQSDVTPYKAAFTTDPEGHLIENVEIPGDVHNG